MTSISDRCKAAREAATPGPWVYEEHKYCPYLEETSLAEAHGGPYPEPEESGCSNLADPECDSCQTRYEVNGHPDGVWAVNPPYHEANPADMRLAALAPEAADEVVRLTEALETLSADLDGNGYDLSEIAAEIRSILNPNGDTND